MTGKVFYIKQGEKATIAFLSLYMLDSVVCITSIGTQDQLK